MNTRYKLFATSQSYVLGERISMALNLPLGALRTEKFQDGEVHVRFEESVRGYVVVIVGQANMPYTHLFELYLAVDAARRASADEVICVIPYVPHSRQERKDKERSSIAARVIADFLENVGASRVFSVDLHSSAIEGLFKIPIDHLDATDLFAGHIKNQNFGPDLALCSPDFGGVKRIKAYNKHLGGDMIVINKERLRANQVENMQVIGQVSGKHVIIIDDIIDTAGTLCKAAEKLVELGATSVRAYCTHGVFSGDALSRIEASALETVVITDTIPQNSLSGKIQVLSTADLLAEAIKKLMTSGMGGADYK